MIRTPSLRSRLTLLTLIVVAVIVVALDVFVYASLADRLDDVLVQVLEARTQTAIQVAATTDTPDELVEALTTAGVPAVVRTADGQELRTGPGQRIFDQLPPSADAVDALQDSAVVEVDDGVQVEVLVSRGGANATLRRVLLLEIGGSAVAMLLALVLVNRVAWLVTRPVDEMVEVAGQIADGRTDLRLDPSDPTTEVGRMGAALDRVVAALDEALTAARREEERSRAFLADAAHQLRTPVAGLRASAETILTTTSDVERDELVVSVAREADRIGRLVNALLAMARLDRPEPIRRVPIDLRDLVDAEVVHQAALAPHVDFRVVAPDDPATVLGDETWLRAALGNLLDNARRHAITGVEVRVEPLVGAWRLVIADDGPGVPPAHGERIFDRFVSFDGDGSGLGLPVARAVAEAHEGSLRLVDDEFELLVPTAASGTPRMIQHG